MRYLGETAKAGIFDLGGAIQSLADAGGPGPFRQALALLLLSYGRRKIRPEEYYTYALWRADRGREFLDQFLPNRRNRTFNGSLKMPARGVADDKINDKIATEAILAARGLPVTKTRALYLGNSAPVDLPALRSLRTGPDIAGFLSDPANLPIFGKPRADSFARGAAVIEGTGSPGTVRFLTGKDTHRSQCVRDCSRLGSGLHISALLPLRSDAAPPCRPCHGLGPHRHAFDRPRGRALVCGDSPAREDRDARR